MNWSGFREDGRDGLVSLDDMIYIFSASMFSMRGTKDYVSNLAKYRADFLGRIRERLPGKAFWGTA